jgi:hypothetical protein
MHALGLVVQMLSAGVEEADASPHSQAPYPAGPFTLWHMLLFEPGTMLPSGHTTPSLTWQQAVAIYLQVRLRDVAKISCWTSLCLADASHLALRLPSPSCDLVAACRPWTWWTGFTGAIRVPLASARPLGLAQCRQPVAAERASRAWGRVMGSREQGRPTCDAPPRQGRQQLLLPGNTGQRRAKAKTQTASWCTVVSERMAEGDCLLH